MSVIPPGALWVRMPRFIGDAVMIHQSLEPLRRAGRALVAWGPAPVMDLFEGSGAFAACVADEGKPGARAMAQLLKAHRAGGVVVLPRSSRALMAGLLAGVRPRVGWREGGGFLFATTSDPFKGRDDHQMDRYTQLLARAFPDTGPADVPAFRPRPEAMAEAARLRSELGLTGPFVVLGMGSAAYVKRLGTEIWKELIPRLRAEGIPGVLLGGTFHEDLAQASELKAAFPDLPDLCGKPSLPVSAALVAQASAVIANDSALAHLAAVSGSPLVAAFGPTKVEYTAPRGPRVRIVRHEALDCLGCLQLACPLGHHACMHQMPVEPLWAAVKEALKR